jgi:hypothetical protein
MVQRTFDEGGLDRGEINNDEDVSIYDETVSGDASDG